MSIKLVNLIRNAARALTIIWAGFWGFFALAHLFEPGPIRLDGLLIIIGFVIFFSVSALIPWKWEFIGGILLVMEGIAEAITYPFLKSEMSFTVIMQMFFMMGLPPLVAGILFLVHNKLVRITKKVE